MDVDGDFYRVFNNVQTKDPTKHYKTIGISKGYVRHASQVLKIYPSCAFGKNNVTYQGATYTFPEFKDAYMSMEALQNHMIRSVENHLHKTDIAIVITSSNPQIALELLQSICINSNVSVILCHVKDVDHVGVINTMKGLTNSYAVLECMDAGNDIAPFLLSYTRIKHFGFKYILKLHTKSDRAWRHDMLRPFRGPLHALTRHFDNYFAMGSKNKIIGHQGLCTRLIQTVIHIEKGYKYVGGTIFFIRCDTLDDILAFKGFVDIYYALLVDNTFHKNTAYPQTSPPHTVERLFGFIPYHMGKKILGL